MIAPIPNRSWPGKLFVASRPRGGDWLGDETAKWREIGIQTVVSLLEQQEELQLEIRDEAREVAKRGMRFISFPIPDRGIPDSRTAAVEMLEGVQDQLQQGKNVLVHCRQGVGRAGMVAASLLVLEGAQPQAAIEQVSKARGVPIPETPDQERWIYGLPARVK